MKHILFLFLFFTTYVTSWDSEGHLLIANMAYRGLSSSTIRNIQQQINIYNKFYPDYSTPLSIAVWLDYIKTLNNTYYSKWHYVDIPYINNTDRRSGEILKKLSTKLKYYSFDSNNVVSIIDQINTTYNKNTDPWNYGLSVRALVHLVGDIHQPFHCVTLYSSQFPKGDGGGNLYKIKYNGKTTNLHSFWDSCGGLFTSTYTYPLSNTSIAKLNNISNVLLSVYHNISYNQTMEVNEWSKESYLLARNFGYNTSYDVELSNEYINMTRYICTERLVVASKRLNRMLSVLF